MMERSSLLVDTSDRLKVEQVLEMILAAVESRTPFSAIRLGDGEGRIMGYPEHTPLLQMSEIWTVWFGHNLFTEPYVAFIRDKLSEACRHADLIGLPFGTPDFNSDFGRVEAIVQLGGYSGPNTRFCNAGVHLELEREEGFRALLEGRASVGLIGPRDIRQAIRESFNVADPMWVVVPPEMRFSNLSDLEKIKHILLDPHLFEHFSNVLNFGIPNIMARGPGTLVLVGAGVLGKIYCYRVKQLGGVALDVGSMMDLWAGLKTRSHPFFEDLTDVNS